MTNNLLSAALAYARLGWAVFPCRPGQKEPLTAHGFKDATTDPATIRRWWQGEPAANIGLACGASGLLAVDLDVKTADGLQTWQDLKAQHGIDDSNTPAARTPSGGRHVIYAAGGATIRNTAGKLGPGIDTRGDGGYIVLAPSTLAGGGAYAWEQSPRECQPAPLPETLAELLTRRPNTQPAAAPTAAPVIGGGAYARAALAGELAELAQAREGERNHALNRSAHALGQFVGAGQLGRAEVEAQLLAAAQALGLGEREAQRTIKSGLDAGEQEPRQVTPRTSTPGNGHRQEPIPPDEPAEPFDTRLLSKAAQALIAQGWQPGKRYAKRFQSAAAAGLQVARELLTRGATPGQVTAILLQSPLAQKDGKSDPGLVAWLLRKAQESPAISDDVKDLRRELLKILTDADRGQDDSATPQLVRWQRAGQALLEYLGQRGYFVLDPATLESYYMDATDNQLLRMDKNAPQWQAWLHNLTGVNPANTAFDALHAEALTCARLEGRRVAVVKVAAWDPDEQLLRVSRFDGSVYRLDGESITLEPNGANGTLFEDDPAWLPYEPDFAPTYRGQPAEGRALAWTLARVPNLDGDQLAREAHELTLQAWLMSTFFPELCPTKPVLVMLGEKGSGKSLTLRVILKMLFGPGGEVSGVPDKPDGFTAAAAGCHVLALDNLDQLTPWLRDKIARLTTGAVDHYRRLYTSNEQGRVTYRCYLACTARTPDTLRRDDLADRLLLVPVNRVESPEPESIMLHNCGALRGAWWGDVLARLNLVVGSLRSDGLPTYARLRMADFEALAQVVARATGQQEAWDRAVKGLEFSQSEFLLDGDPIVEALTQWLQTEANQGRAVTAGELYTELTDLLFPGDKKPSGWYKSGRSFAKALGNIKRDLGKLFTVTWEKGTTRTGRTRGLIYTFRLPTDGDV